VKSKQDTASQTADRIGRRGFLGKTAIGAAGAVSLPAILAACGSTTAAGGAGSEGNFPSHTQWNFVFVNHVTTNPFFTPTQYGIQDACALLGCKYQWTGSASSNVSEMVNAMNTAISGKADGIAVAIIDQTAFDAPTAQAIAAGIPVVSYNADAPTGSPNKRMAYIGQDLYQSGYTMGTRIAGQLKAGKCVGFIATPGSLNIQPRIDGFKAALNALSPAVEFTQITTGADVNGETTNVEAYYLGHTDVNCMVAVDGGSTQGVAICSQKHGLTAKGVLTGGYDLLPKTLQLIQSGDMGFTIDQQPYLQGFVPVVQLFLYKLSGGLQQPSNTDTGLLFITKDNVGPYLNTTTRFEGSTTAEKNLSSN
jgi:simple sugar transport system substrate-binding protein